MVGLFENAFQKLMSQISIWPLRKTWLSTWWQNPCWQSHRLDVYCSWPPGLHAPQEGFCPTPLCRSSPSNICICIWSSAVWWPARRSCLAFCWFRSWCCGTVYNVPHQQVRPHDDVKNCWICLLNWFIKTNCSKEPIRANESNKKES